MPNPVQQSPPLRRPYASQYVALWRLKDGTAVTIRPIRPEDESMAVDFYQKLSDRSVYLRYFRSKQADKAALHEYLKPICCVDYNREMVLVAMYENRISSHDEMIAGARLVNLHGSSEAECAIIVADGYHNRGLGTELCRRLLEIARVEAVQRVTCAILPGNVTMCTICSRFGFDLEF
ncbi:MAG: GNAT family N-acetyltransferase, partial [Candidatus Korobacteraceae bacterium]